MYRTIVRRVPAQIKAVLPRSLKAALLHLAYRVTRNPAVGVACARHLVRQGASDKARQLLDRIDVKLKANEAIALSNKQELQFRLAHLKAILDGAASEDPLVNTRIVRGKPCPSIGKFTVKKKFLGLSIGGKVKVDKLPIPLSGRVLKANIRVNGEILRREPMEEVDGVLRFKYNIKRPALDYMPREIRVEVAIAEVGKLTSGGSDFVTIINELASEGAKELDLPTALNKKGTVAEGTDEISQNQTRFLEIYDSVNKVFMEATGKPLFLLYGSLLGLYRDGDFIPGDDDFDIGYLSKESDPLAVKEEAKLIMEKLAEAGLTIVMNRRGKPFRVKDTRISESLHLDARPVWFQDGKFWAHKQACLDLKPEQFEQCELMDFRGYKVHVPSGTEAFLRAYYGKGWKKPDPSFSNSSVKVSGNVISNLSQCCLTLDELKSMRDRLAGRGLQDNYVAISLQDLYPLDQYSRQAGW